MTFRLAHIWWHAATRDWPEAYAILMIEANDDVAPFHDRQMAVLRRDQRMAWLDRTSLEEEMLRPLPAGTFVVSQPREVSAQAALAF
jgi:putative SOS response-associated peptidase YedK